MSSPTQYNMSSDDITISVRPVVPFSRHPECPKCGHSLGFFAWWLSATGSCAQNWGFCQGDVDSTISINIPIQQMFGGAEAKIPTVCFGNVEEHIHIRCSRCNHLWLMAVKPPKKSRKGLPPWRLLMFLLGILFTLLVTEIAHCEELTENAVLVAPAAKPKFHIDKATLGEWAGDTAIRSLDALSTQRAARCGCNHEAVLPDFISKRPVMLWSYSLGVPLVNLAASRMLARHGHRWLKHSPFAVDISLELPAVIGNMQLRDKMPKGMVVLRRVK